MTRPLTALTVALAAVILPCDATVAQADTARRLYHLMSVPGVSGYETPVREALEMLLPVTARVRADNLGNIILRTGSGAPHTLIVAPLDEGGFVVSAITEDGYLRLHRHTPARGGPLGVQFFVGQPILVRAADGRMVPGVTVTPSSHLRGQRDPAADARVRGLDDLWVDVGAQSRAEAEALGIRLLDSVTLRDRAIQLAGQQVSGVAAAGRAAALALAEVVRRGPGRGAAGSVTLAWIAQSEFGNRGLLRLLETLTPDRLVVLRGAPEPGADAAGAVGELGTGPVVADGDIGLPDRWADLAVRTAHVPVRFAHTPVETVDARDVDALAEWIATQAGLPALAPPESTPPDSAAPGARPAPASRDLAYDTLEALIETHGVSGHESAVRQQVLARLPAWAAPQVDERGNVTVSFGSGGKPLVFVAHLDEVGFEITRLTDEGGAAVRARGGMYLSLYEAHPVLVDTPQGPVPAVLAPRVGYTTATAAQPAADALFVYFGTRSAAETKALGVAEGQSLTIRKQLAPLGPHRAAGRAMDDRVGTTALLLALRQLDPKTVENQVTFAWVVEEETGLAGAAHLAGKMKPDTAFAVDTFVSTDTPVDIQRMAGAPLGGGAVLRVLDSRTIVPPHVVTRIVALARDAGVPLQLGVTSGGTDASAFSAGGAIDVGLSWPGRYSHSPVEVMDRRDLDALVRLIVAVARGY